MVPTLTATLGVKGHRPVVGTRDCKDLLYVLASVDVVSGKLLTRTLESAARVKRKTGISKTRRLQVAFSAHLGDVAAAHRGRKTVMIIDNAPWHRGRLIDAVLSANPHLHLYRLPSYSPQLNVIERFWKTLRRRAAHNRLFDDLADLKHSLRNSLRYFQTVRSRILRLIGDCYGFRKLPGGT